MWRSRSNSNLRIHNNSSSIFSCSSFKDIQNLYYDDDNSQSQHIPNPTPNPSPRPSRSPSPNPNPNPSVFHRVRLANSVVRAFSNRPLPHPVPISEPVLDTVSELPAESKPSPARAENAVTLHVSVPLPGHVSDSEPELPAGFSSAPAFAENVAKEPVPEPVTVLELETELPLERYASENVIKQQEPKISIPGAEKRVVVYLTSLRVVRSTFEDCRAVQSILRGFRVTVDERDLSMDSSFLGELQRILGHYEKTKLTLPRVFIGGRYIGGADEVITLHETGELKKIVQGLPAAAPGVCEVCGGYRFILCDECNGSHKCFTESGGFRSCTSCIENGLIRCPSCACEPL